MNTLNRKYRVAVRPLHLESLESYSIRLLSKNQETFPHLLTLIRLAKKEGATGSDETVWADVIHDKTGRELATPGAGSLATFGYGAWEAGRRFLCTRCSNGDTASQLPHFAQNVCLKHNRWVGPRTTPETQVTTDAVIAAAERRFLKLRAADKLNLARYDMLRTCLNPISQRMTGLSTTQIDAALYPIVIRLATLVSSEHFSREFFDPNRCYASAYQFLVDQTTPILPSSQRKVTRILWLYFRSTFLAVRENFDNTTREPNNSNDFAIHPKVVGALTRPIGPYESFAAFLVPTGDDGTDSRRHERSDSYDKLKNICRMGHRLTKPITRTDSSMRAGTDNCPVCMHRELRTGVNDMATTHPRLAAELHPTKNGNLTSRTIFTNTHTKLTWLCEKDDRHVYEATGSNRAAAGSHCSVCLNRVIIKDVNDLHTLFPLVAREWHPTKNANVSIDVVAAGSNEPAWWLCPAGHTYRKSVGNRTRGGGCHVCGRVANDTRSLSVARPDLAAEMHPTQNGMLTPDKISIGSRKDIVWICPNGHNYTQRPERRCEGYGCPVCSGRRLEVGVNDIQTRYPEISTEWHSWMNGAIEPCDLIPGNRKFWWKCSVAGHLYEQNVPHRVEAGGCPLCAPTDRIAHNIAR